MKGIYFKSDKDNTSHFLITFEVLKPHHNTVAIIYDIPLPQKDLTNGDKVESFEAEIFCKLDIWNKYYFPEFYHGDNNQWYHNYNGKEDRIGAVCDVLKYGLDTGLIKGNIKVY